jgi:hypothetical protein
MNISDKLMERYGKPHLSYSSIKKALSDMALFDLYMKGAIEYKSDELEFGTMYDMLLFERDKALKTYMVVDHDLIMERCSPTTQSTKSPKATKEYKEVRDAIEIELAEKGKVACTKEDWKMANEMIDRLVNSGVYQKFLSGRHQVEVYQEINGVTVKGYIDCLGEGFISDSKSSRSIDGFKYDVSKMCYDVQAYIYCKAMGIKTFYWVVQEKTYPFLPAVVKCTDQTLFAGEMKFLEAVSRITKFVNGTSDPMEDYITFEV